MDLLKTEACQEIDKHAQDLGSLATKIWNLAEPGGKEVKSAEAIIGFLVAHEFVVTKNYRGMPTAFRAEFGESEYGGRKRPNVCFVCRYDANKKKGHVNGNNLVTQVAVAAALGLKAVIRASSAGIGKASLRRGSGRSLEETLVTLLGCPNSAKGWLIKMLNRKAFLDIDVVLSAAPGDRTEWNPTYVASKTYRATYTGSLGNMEGDNIIPGTSALDGAVYAYSNILAMREHFGPGWQAEGVISRGGHSMYVVPTQCETTVKITGPTDRDLALLERRVLPCFDAAAQSSGCELELVLGDKSYRGMINNTTLVYMMQINAYYCGILATPLKKKKIMSSVDIANVSRILPAVRPIFYIGTDAEIGTDEFKMAANTENAHWYANSMGKTLALTAIDFLQTPLTMFNCKQDLVNRLKQEKEETTFMMFPVNQVANLSLATALPADSNTGWSRLM